VEQNEVTGRRLLRHLGDREPDPRIVEGLRRLDALTLAHLARLAYLLRQQAGPGGEP
jgi:hypothetical protein